MYLALKPKQGDIDMKNYLKFSGVVGSILLSSNAVGELIITEIMKNPNAVNDVDGEWFEVYNTGGSALDLNGWTIKDSNLNPNSFTINTSLTISPDTYLVFGNNGNSSTNGNVIVDWQYAGFTLGNSADDIQIFDGNNDLIDSVFYDAGITFPAPIGASMELILSAYTSTANDLGSNWFTATTPWATGSDLGTPGNSPVPVPAAVWLFGSGLLGLIGIARQKITA
jgi:hypothetical protein